MKYQKDVVIIATTGYVVMIVSVGNNSNKSRVGNVVDTLNISNKI